VDESYGTISLVGKSKLAGFGAMGDRKVLSLTTTIMVLPGAGRENRKWVVGGGQWAACHAVVPQGEGGWAVGGGSSKVS